MIKNSVFAIIAVVFIAASCVKVPITNRKQLNLMPESQLIGMSDTMYTQFLATNKVLPASDPRTKRVKTIGLKIQNEVEKFLKKHHASKRTEGFSWEFNLVDDPTVNAWCMPGGKVVVYTGILELASTDDELATVMGHEIAHAIARHGNERMSQQFAIQGLGGTLGAIMGENPSKGKNVFLQAYGIGSTLGVLKYSRNHESESDKLGLVFMALAGYDVNKAITFWEKMAANGGSTPEILSTHPSDARRIQDIKDFIPEIPNYTKGVE